jgi:sugar transferase (PEP-CTERM/EpsH1 system associated)
MILLLTHRVPYPPDKGDRIRTYHLLKFLAQRCDLYLASLADEPVPTETIRKLESLCRRVYIAPVGGLSRKWHAFTSLLGGRPISEGMFFSTDLRTTVQQWHRELNFKGGVASASSVAGYLDPLIESKARTIVDLVDVDSEKWFEYYRKSSFPKSWLFHREGRRLRQVERELCSRVSEVTLVSAGEVKLFAEQVLPGRARAITNGVDLDYFSPQLQRPEERGCVFVGAMDYRPNVDAAVWFAREIWPKIQKQFPGHRFSIVGRNPTTEVLKLQEIPGVEVSGTVPDVREFVRDAAVSVAPLRIARGLQNKVLEALAMGRAVIGSPQSLAGFASEVPAIRAETVDEWVVQLSTLLESPEKRLALGIEGRRFAETYHDWDRCLEPFAELLQLPSGQTVTSVG